MPRTKEQMPPKMVLYYRQRYKSLITHYESMGLKYVYEKSEKNQDDEKMIDHKAVMHLLNMEPKYIQESPKCIKLVQQYINDKQSCIMFYKLESKCIHTQPNSTNDTYFKHISKLLLYPHVYAPFRFDIQDGMNYFEWLDNLVNTKQNHSICYECIIQFFSYSPTYEKFMEYSQSLGLKTCNVSIDLLKLCMDASPFPNTLCEEDEDIKDIKQRIFIIVQITDLWHRFMIHPQFIKYYLLKNMKLFKAFLAFWHSMRAIQQNYMITGKAMKCFSNKASAAIFELNSNFERYLAERFVDISYCFYSAMKYLRKKHLGKKYLGRYIDLITRKIGGFNVCDDDYFQCVLNLMWKIMTFKYKKYEIDMIKLSAEKLILIPINDHDDHSLNDKVRRKLKERIKCGNYLYCGIKGNLHSKMKLCSRCKISVYCSRKCQKRKWKYYHRYFCKPLIF